jgi:penicillin-binding protein 1A
MAHNLGVTTPLPPYPSVGLGAAAVSPLEMASAYATLAAGGVYSRPMAIRRVVLSNGKVDDEAGWGKVERKRVLGPAVAWEVTRILEENVLQGTGTAAYFGRPAAGKTGTTDNHADAWFCGYTPNLMTAVWVGYPQAQIPMLSVHGISVAGGTFPAEIWHRFMAEALKYTPPYDWTEPDTEVEWQPFTRGKYSLGYSSGYDSGYDYGYSPPAPTTTESAPPPPPPPPAEPPPAPAEPSSPPELP